MTLGDAEAAAGTLNAEAAVVLEQAVRSVFSSWSVLQLAVNNQFGGITSAQKATEMIDGCVRFLKRGEDIYADEIESILLSTLEDDFDLVLEDGTAGAVARHLVQLYQQCSAGDLSGAQQAIQRAQSVNVSAALAASVGGDAEDAADAGIAIGDEDAVPNEVPQLTQEQLEAAAAAEAERQAHEAYVQAEREQGWEVVQPKHRR